MVSPTEIGKYYENTIVNISLRTEGDSMCKLRAGQKTCRKCPARNYCQERRIKKRGK